MRWLVCAVCYMVVPCIFPFTYLFVFLSAYIKYHHTTKLHMHLHRLYMTAHPSTTLRSFITVQRYIWILERRWTAFLCLKERTTVCVVTVMLYHATYLHFAFHRTTVPAKAHALICVKIVWVITVAVSVYSR